MGRTASVITASLVIAACSSESFTGDPDGTDDVAQDTTVDTTPDTAPADTGHDDPDLTGTCTPQLLILIDRSQSMAEGDPVRWEVLRAALASALASDAAAGIDLGLGAFPTAHPCETDGAVLEPVPTATASSADALFTSSAPYGNTPTVFVLEQILADPSVARADETEPAFLLVVTDGSDNCFIDCLSRCGMHTACLDACMGEIDPLAAAQLMMVTSALRTDHHVQTFAIGMGPDLSPDQLDAIAEGGGTEAPYRVETEVELTEALMDVLGRIMACD